MNSIIAIQHNKTMQKKKQYNNNKRNVISEIFKQKKKKCNATMKTVVFFNTQGSLRKSAIDHRQ